MRWRRRVLIAVSLASTVIFAAVVFAFVASRSRMLKVIYYAPLED